MTSRQRSYSGQLSGAATAPSSSTTPHSLEIAISGSNSMRVGVFIHLMHHDMPVIAISGALLGGVHKKHFVTICAE